MEKIVIGLTGSICSGKDTLAKHLVSQGFKQLILSDRIRDEIRNRGQEINRTLLQDVGNELRETYGGAVLVERTALLIAKTDSNIIIDGVRNPEEMKYIYNNLEGFVIGVNAPREKRLEWYLAREKDRGEDGKTEADFKKHDDRDFGLDEPGLGQQVGKCLEMADVVLWNNGTREELFSECDQFLKEIFNFDKETHLRPQEKK